MNFTNVRLALEHDSQSIYTEESNWRFESLSFEGRSTPQVVTTYFYPKITSEPSDTVVSVNMTYQQLKGDQ